MSRNTHHRDRDHFGTDSTTNITIAAPVGGNPTGTDLQEVLEDLALGNVTAGLSMVMDSQTGLSTGVKGYVEIPFVGVITSARLFSDQTTSTVVDIWKVTYMTYPGSSANSICASSKPTLSSALKSENSLSGWTTSVGVGDILIIHIDSNSASRKLTLALTMTKTI